jgi:hypothetical protein
VTSDDAVEMYNVFDTPLQGYPEVERPSQVFSEWYGISQTYGPNSPESRKFIGEWAKKYDHDLEEEV